MSTPGSEADPLGRLSTFVSLTWSAGPIKAAREGYRFARGSVRGVSTPYWACAPTWYRWQLQPETDAYGVPVDIFKRVRVDPERITRFTGRPYDPPTERWRRFGDVLEGDWDRRLGRSIPDGTVGPPRYPEIYFADRFGETTLHRSLEAHFRDGRAWEETRFIEQVHEFVDAGHSVWQDCRTREDVDHQCARLDALYGTIASTGLQSMLEMARRGEVHRSFPSAISNEIVVDIGRDGTLLFANGRHRLSIAKILGLERVPVAILVRHADWMHYREEVHHGRHGQDGHPDLRSSGG